MTRHTLQNIADDIRKLAELILAGIMTPAIASTAAELIDASGAMASVILALGWTIVIARLAVTVLELWERYGNQPPDSANQ